LKQEKTDDPEYNNFTKGTPSRQTALSGAHTSSVTTLTVTSGDEQKFKKGDILKNMTEGSELILVTLNPSVAGQIPVDRGFASSTAALGSDAAQILCIGSAYEEGSGSPEAVSYDTVVGTNYTQIFKNSMEITGTAMKTKMRWASNPWAELRRETLQIHGIDIERAIFLGKKSEATGPDGKKRRSTGGFNTLVTTNVTDFAAGGVSEDGLDTALEGVFRNGSPEKAVFLGGTALRILNRIAKKGSDFVLDDTKTTYGVSINTWQTSFGKLKLIQHPLFSENSIMRTWAFVIDTRNIVYRYMDGRDTTLQEKIQETDADGRKDQYMTECGLELRFEDSHAIFKGMSAYAAS